MHEDVGEDELDPGEADGEGGQGVDCTGWGHQTQTLLACLQY